MAIVRLAAVVFALEALFYALLWVYLRSLRRERLEKEWASARPDAPGDGPERRAFVERSIEAHHGSLRVRLIGLVFVLPTVAIAAIIYFVNYD